MAYVSRSPPIMPDGQISRVRFETSACLLWAFPTIGEVETLVRVHPRHSGLPSASPPELSWRYAGFIKPAAIRPSKPPSVLSPFARLRCYLRRGDVCHLLRGRYPPVIAPTGSCATPVGLSPPSALSLVRRVFAGCTQSLLPTGASRRYL